MLGGFLKRFLRGFGGVGGPVRDLAVGASGFWRVDKVIYRRGVAEKNKRKYERKWG